jgi:chromosome segregation ATPase
MIPDKRFVPILQQRKQALAAHQPATDPKHFSDTMRLHNWAQAQLALLNRMKQLQRVTEKQAKETRRLSDEQKRSKLQIQRTNAAKRQMMQERARLQRRLEKEAKEKAQLAETVADLSEKLALMRSDLHAGDISAEGDAASDPLAEAPN